MAASLARPLSEHEQDPNSALLQLDRGLKSSNVGEQCEAISRFPNLFEKYPFPILINSALLKLAEVYRQETSGSNFVRQCVCEVLDSCTRHLDKLINVEEFLQRITSVMHSNDPLARALTLRAIGQLSGVVGESKQVHHLIRDSLGSFHNHELQSAILTASRYAAVSKVFALSMCERLTHMLSDLSTPVQLKLQLIQIFEHMHHDTDSAEQVRQVCLGLLETCPSQRIVMATLEALTQLASHCLVHIPHQVALLLKVVGEDSRSLVRSSVLRQLEFLASAAPHAWTQDNVKDLVALAEKLRNTEDSALLLLSLDVLACLTSAPTLHHSQYMTPGCTMLALASQCVYHQNSTIATTALQLYTNLALLLHNSSDNNCTTCQKALHAGISLVTTLSYSNTPGRLKIPLISCVLLARCSPNISASLANTMVPLLPRLPHPNTLLMCEALASLGGSRKGVFSPHLSTLVSLLSAPSNTPQLTCVLANLVAVTCLGRLIDPTTANALKEATFKGSSWLGYRIARSLSRYGHHSVAVEIFATLRSRVASVKHHYWLSALHKISYGEAIAVTRVGGGEGHANILTTDVVDDRATPLTEASNSLYIALVHLRACSSSEHRLTFVQQFTAARAESLAAHSQLVTICQSMRTSPPPAIAASQVASLRDEMARCCRLVQQLDKLAEEFRAIAARYGRLYQSQFDADPETLTVITGLQMGSSLMAAAINSLTKPGGRQIGANFSGGLVAKGEGSVVLALQDAALRRAEAAINLLQSHVHATQREPLTESMLNELTLVSEHLTGVSLPYPRLFYQSLQHTSISLNVSPHPRTPGDAIVIQNSSQLAVKVEGIISHGERPGLFRSIKSVCLSLTTTSRPLHPDNKSEPSEILSQTAQPHNDFFSAQFLLSFSTSGQYQVTIDATVTDNHDQVWQTGPRHSISIKAQDDTTIKNAPPSQSAAPLPLSTARPVPPPLVVVPSAPPPQISANYSRPP